MTRPDVRNFGTKAIHAINHARDGGQALHIFKAIEAWKQKAPACFRATDTWAHLFDQDTERLRATGMALGLAKPYIHREGTIGQHIDLCGKPLALAIDICRQQE